MAVLSGTKAAIKVCGPSGTTATVNATFTKATKVAKADESSRRHWDPDASSLPKVYLNSTLVPAAKLRTVDYVKGTVTYTTWNSTGTYTMDVSYLTASSWANAAQWTLNISGGVIPANRFSTEGWSQGVAGMRSAQASLGGFYTLNAVSSAPMAYDYINTAERMLVELYPSATAGDRYEGFAWITGNQVGAAADGLVGETVDLTFDGPVSWTTST